MAGHIPWQDKIGENLDIVGNNTGIHGLEWYWFERQLEPRHFTMCGIQKLCSRNALIIAAHTHSPFNSTDESPTRSQFRSEHDIFALRGDARSFMEADNPLRENHR